MFSIKVPTASLLQYAEVLRTRQMKMKAAVTKSLNYIGDQTVEKLAQQVAQETGLNIIAARKLIKVRRATSTRNYYEIDVGQVLTQGRSRSATAQGRRERIGERDQTGFTRGQLVNIVTMGDEKVCPQCEELAEASPYTIEEARAQLPHHPNCRCVVEEFTPSRKLPVQMRSGRGAAAQVYSSSLTLQDLAATVRANAGAVMRATR